MQVLEVGQEGYDWHAYRRAGIGSSEAPIIMGVHKNKKEWTLKKLLEQKRSKEILVDDKKHYILEKGKRLEPRIRAMLEVQTGLTFKPVCVINGKIIWLRASLDGLTACHRYICEVKFTGKANYDLVAAGKVPVEHWPQVQHGLMVTNAEKNFYVVGIAKEHKKEKDILIKYLEVEPDLPYQRILYEKELAFWNLVQGVGEAELSEGDVVEIQEADQVRAAEKWLDLKSKILALEKDLDEVDAELKAYAAKAGHTRYKCLNLLINKVTAKGSVNYKKIPELKGVDLERYRGNDKVYFKIAQEK